MFFTSVINRDYKLTEIGAIIRILLGVNLISYYLIEIMPRFFSYFGHGGMVNPSTFSFYSGSPLFLLWNSPSLLFVFFLFTLALALAFTFGYYARFVHIPLYLMIVFFHNANPFIIHEPHQLSNLMLVLAFFFPIEGKWIIKKTNKLAFFENVSSDKLYYVYRLMLIYIALYYFFAGLKKIPDPLWLSGDALGTIISWPFLGRDNFLTNFLLEYPMLLKLMNYTALIYEISFIGLIFIPKVKKWLIPVGIIFHIMINFTLDVGHFHLAMWLWYPLLLAEKGQD